jgi:hypothetical protein
MTGASGYSGLSMPQPAEKNLNSTESRKLHHLLEEEEQAKQVALLAAQRRDKFCIEIEKRYGLAGYNWEVAFAGNVASIVIKGARK